MLVICGVGWCWKDLAVTFSSSTSFYRGEHAGQVCCDLYEVTRVPEMGWGPRRYGSAPRLLPLSRTKEQPSHFFLSKFIFVNIALPRYLSCKKIQEWYFNFSIWNVKKLVIGGMKSFGNTETWLTNDRTVEFSGHKIQIGALSWFWGERLWRWLGWRINWNLAFT